VWPVWPVHSSYTGQCVVYTEYGPIHHYFKINETGITHESGTRVLAGYPGTGYGTGTFRAQNLSFPRTNSPYGELSFPRRFVPGNSLGTKVPWNFRSRPLSFSGTFVPGERKFLGTFVPWTFRSEELSFPGTFVSPTILQGIGYERRQL